MASYNPMVTQLALVKLNGLQTKPKPENHEPGKCLIGTGVVEVVREETIRRCVGWQ